MIYAYSMNVLDPQPEERIRQHSAVCWIAETLVSGGQQNGNRIYARKAGVNNDNRQQRDYNSEAQSPKTNIPGR